ncbi:MAG: Nudix family [Lasallia pustulata]|uniref:Nudix family n=1 Tax=Lasallia pustulata TaxID=136370 RepID=A0A5M8Q1E3_9LECA|nr:MAG: Nudix family [Lasallia pustulata]
MAQNRSMEARTGRVNQRYGPSGERLVAGVVALSPTKTQVLLIQATKRTSWVLPKGGWELDEATPAMAACREAWEEAGVICTVVRDLGKIPEMAEGGGAGMPKVEYRFFEVSVEREESQWPEMGKRERSWMGYAQAKGALKDRPELVEALERSAIVR